ncbi:CBS domain-containing protein [Virgibacillus sp. YIM 98842]|jgi:CBS domain-containing protein|uniref:CBS domain-containing protein n=1 Tax=Virgibacillus sp. YIM 98842 TaxID=2663533 RepID=UPI0013D8EF78|nr:CBS domain-containing protein [Virgibacillus sp. YIM 98842]
MYKNSEKFLTAFTKIEKQLKSRLNNRRDIGFARSVKILRSSNAIVRRYSEDLLSFAELRNAIVHNKIDMAYAIAEPHDSIVERIQRIEKELTHPTLVGSVFSKEVFTFQETDSLADMLMMFREKDLSKFPIYEKNIFKGLLTQKGIAKWLANNEGDPRLASKTLIREVLPFEGEENYKFIANKASVYRAVEIFREQIGRGKRLEALLITKTGTPQERLTGIITAWDILDAN